MYLDYHTLARGLNFVHLGCWRGSFGMLTDAQHFHNELRCDEFMPDVSMVCSGMVLRPVVSVGELAWAPIDAESVLAFTIAQPIEIHVYGLCLFWLDFSVYNTLCCGVVSLERGGRLRVAHFHQDDANEDSLSGHDVQHHQFSFGGGGHDMFDDVGNIQDGPMVGWDFCIG